MLNANQEENKVNLIKINTSSIKSKESQSFLKKINEIEKLKLKNQKLEQILSEIKISLIGEMGPLSKKLCDIRFSSLTILEEKMKLKYFKRKEKKEIKGIIVNGSYELLKNFHDERGESFLNKYSKLSVSEIEDEEEEVYDFLKSAFGFNEDESNDDFQQSDRKKKWDQRNERKLLKEKDSINKVNTGTKSIYRELMKEFHPDLEQDKETRKEKEEISKKITDAYHDNNMYELLKLRSEYLDISVEGRDLELYLSGLNLKIKGLKSENRKIKVSYGEVYSNIYSTSKKVITRRIKEAVKEVEQDLFSEQEMLEEFSDNSKLRNFLLRERQKLELEDDPFSIFNELY